MNFKINVSNSPEQNKKSILPASKIKSKTEKQIFLFLFIIFLFIFALSSCETFTSSGDKSSAKFEEYNLTINEKHPYLQQLYYRDIISFRADNITENFITYDADKNIYYIPGKTNKTIKSGSHNIEFITVSAASLIGFVCVGSDTILYSDNSGNVYKLEKKNQGNWVEKKLFSAKLGQKPFNTMTADQKNIYLYSEKDKGIHKLKYSGKAEAFIKISGLTVSGLDVKSSYLYLLSSTGLIILADYKQNKIETEYMTDDFDIFNTTFLVKQDKSETELILSKKGSKSSSQYAIYPLSSLHKMVIEEGYIRRVSPQIAGCSYVLCDSNGNIIFPLKSTLINLETAISGKVTVTGMIYDTENSKIVVVSAIDN